MKIVTLIFISGLLHFGILFASALVPRTLDWKQSLRGLDPLMRELVWVHGAFIVLVIAAFGLVSVLLPHELAGGTALARAVCGFIALFWGARLGVQIFLFHPESYLKTKFLKVGYHALTVVFAFHTVVYALAALHTHSF